MRRQCVPGPTFSTPAQSARKIGTGNEAILDCTDTHGFPGCEISMSIIIVYVIETCRCRDRLLIMCSINYREALKRWKEKEGSDATYAKLHILFNANGYKHCADLIRQLYTQAQQSPRDSRYPPFLRNFSFQCPDFSLALNIVHFTVILLIALTLIYLIPDHSPSKLSGDLPILTPNFVGRQTDIKKVLQVIDYTDGAASRIISITGAPGFGKSTLAIRIGHKLTKDDVQVLHIDMNEVTGEYELTNYIFKNLEILNVKYANIYMWSKDLDQKTLLIFDNCDENFHTNDSDFQLKKIITKLVQHSDYKSLKIMTTSRDQVKYIEKYFPLVLHEFPLDQSCELLHKMVDSLDPVVCPDIANLTGNAPLALKIVAALMNMPDSPNSDEIISQLQDNVIDTLSPEDLAGDRISMSIYLSYKFLNNDMQRVGRFLSYFPGSFDRNVSAEIISHIIPNDEIVYDQDPLRILVKMSLLDHNTKTERYVYHRLIREYFKSMSTLKELKEFNTYFLNYYTVLLEKREEKYFVQVLHKFDSDGHNFKYFFDQLGSNVKNREDVKRFKRVTDILGDLVNTDLRITTMGIINPSISGQGLYTDTDTCTSQVQEINLFTVELLQHIIRSHLLNMKKLMEIYDRGWFVNVYSRLVSHLVYIEPDIINDTSTLVKHMIEHEWIYDKHGDIISSPLYIDFFSELAEYYNELQNGTLAKLCHERVLQKKMTQFKCTNCSYLEAAEEYLNIEEYERSMYYCSLELESIIAENEYLPEKLEDVMITTEKLIKLHKMYSFMYKYEKDATAGLEDIAAEISNISESRIIVANPQKLVDYAHVIVYVIDLLKNYSTNETLHNIVKFHFKHGIETYQKNQDSLFELILTLYTDENNYEMVVFIGEAFLKTNISKEQFIMTYYYVEQSLFLSGKYSQSIMTYYENSLNGSKYYASSQLMAISSLSTLPDRLPGLFHHYAICMIETFFTFISGSVSNPSHTDCSRDTYTINESIFFGIHRIYSKITFGKTVSRARGYTVDIDKNFLTDTLLSIFNYFPSFHQVLRLYIFFAIFYYLYRITNLYYIHLSDLMSMYTDCSGTFELLHNNILLYLLFMLIHVVTMVLLSFIYIMMMFYCFHFMLFDCSEATYHSHHSGPIIMVSIIISFLAFDNILDFPKYILLLILIVSTLFVFDLIILFIVKVIVLTFLSLLGGLLPYLCLFMVFYCYGHSWTHIIIRRTFYFFVCFISLSALVASCFGYFYMVWSIIKVIVGTLVLGTLFYICMFHFIYL